MKQRQYSEVQLAVMEVIGRLTRYLSHNGLEEIEWIRKDYKIEKPLLTLRQYINSHCSGSYHTFHFTLENKEIEIDTIGDMLTDDLCSLYPLTNKFYVVKVKIKQCGSDCENYHSDHYLTLEPKED